MNIKICKKCLAGDAQCAFHTSKQILSDQQLKLPVDRRFVVNLEFIADSRGIESRKHLGALFIHTHSHLLECSKIVGCDTMCVDDLMRLDCESMFNALSVGDECQYRLEHFIHDINLKSGRGEH